MPSLRDEDLRPTERLMLGPGHTFYWFKPGQSWEARRDD